MSPVGRASTVSTNGARNTVSRSPNYVQRQHIASGSSSVSEEVRTPSPGLRCFCLQSFQQWSTLLQYWQMCLRFTAKRHSLSVTSFAQQGPFRRLPQE